MASQAEEVADTGAKSEEKHSRFSLKGLLKGSSHGKESRSRSKPRRVIPELPRATTFKRVMSEKRENLVPAPVERPRDRSVSNAEPPPAVDEAVDDDHDDQDEDEDEVDEQPLENDMIDTHRSMQRLSLASSTLSSHLPPSPPEDEVYAATTNSYDIKHFDDESKAKYRATLDAEISARWILNLTMTFKDDSPREKFFITYTPSHGVWRRITVSVDYRHARKDSLEWHLKRMAHHRDKAARIYEALRLTLSEVVLYDDCTTNLKLETDKGKELHIIVSRDENETVEYPDVGVIEHIHVPHLTESDLEYVCHISGFVYKVHVPGQQALFIKKEISTPDGIEAFLYEVNALYTLREHLNIANMVAIVVDDKREVVRGIILEDSKHGALADYMYEFRADLTMERRLKWAQQIVRGLAAIHESGHVQGDLTFSNICLDEMDNCQIIDLNHRGCPIGWEPPEFLPKLRSRALIMMFVGVKSDLYQLGMVLYGLATNTDEPERNIKPLYLDDFNEGIPKWYRKLTNICLSASPQERLPAIEILRMFPHLEIADQRMLLATNDSRDLRSSSSHSSLVRNEGYERLHQDVKNDLRSELLQSDDEEMYRGRSSKARAVEQPATEGRRLYPMDSGVADLEAGDSPREIEMGLDTLPKFERDLAALSRGQKGEKS